MPGAVELAQPGWLLVAPLLVALLVAARLPWWRAARRSGRDALRREGRRLGIRLAWSVALLLALTGPSLALPLQRQAVVWVVDVSASMTPARDQVEAAVRAAADGLPDGDYLGVVAVADGAQVEETPSADPLFARLASALPSAASDLADGLRLAGAILPQGFAGRVVLVSDGRQTRDDAIAAARDLAARGVVVDVLPLGASGADVLVESVDLPQTAYQGEVATLRARLHATVPTPATLRLYRDENLLLERQVELRGGSQEVVLPVPVGEPGLHRYRLDVAPGAPGVDSTTVNNALGAIQQVVGPPRALIVATDPALAGFLPDALRAAGAEVEVVPPAGVPADLAGWAQYDVAVLADVPVEALPPGVMETVERFVRDLGRGLVMTGGPSSFGPGGYADTPVERALPVYMDLRGRGRQPRVALVLVVDKSGSMAGTKMELAKEAAARSIRLLRPGDQAAVVAFDSVPQWVAPLTPVSELARLEQAVGSIYAGGGTEIYPALVAGFEGLRQADADVKHVILLTDGRSGSSGEYLELLQRMREERVTLSTVAVGTDADTGLLEAMARVGRGRYHFAASPEDIPEIFARETIMATRTILVDLEFFPSVASPGPLLQGLTAVPPLRGYVAVTPKERAEVLLVSPENDPVLAAWQYGAGRAVAWTPDVGGRWSEAWASSPAATILWGNVLSWLLPPRDGGELSVRVEAENERAFAVIAENRGNWDEVRPTRATLLGPDRQRQEVDLVPAGPGRYRGVVAPPEPGAYVVQVTQVAGDGVELRGEAGWVAPYPAEFRATGVDGALLAQVAAAGGGRVLTDPVEGVQPAQRSAVARWPLWPLLLTLAALLWPLEIAARRLALPPLAARLPLPRRAAAPRAEAGELSPSSDGVATPPSPAAATTQRLLQRKRELRDERRQRAR